jgi:hypothetical protein
MSTQNEKEIPWQVNFPDEDRVTRHFKTSLVDICCGNERIADALDYFVYTASWEVKNKGLPKGSKVAKITRTHKEIMEKLQFNTSRRSLIHYLDLFNEWGYVLSQPYQRDFEVSFEAIQKAINDPSKRPQRSTRSKVKPQEEETDKKGCNVADLHTCTEGCEHAKKVAILHTKVADLQHKVATLHKKVESLATLQPAFEALVKLVEGHFSEPTVITSILPLLTGKEDVASACAERNAPSPSSTKIYLMEKDIVVESFDEWYASEKGRLPQAEELHLSPVAIQSIEPLHFIQLSPVYPEQDVNPYGFLPEITSTENAKLHRLTSRLETLSEQNVSTDESLARIERETANHPSSSLVVDSPNAEMTHADARNTTNSYSPHSTLTSAIPETVQSDGEEVTLAEKSAQPVGKGRGSKKKPKVDLDKVKPLPRPERPSDEMPWNAKKLLAWGDYFRGHMIPFSERANSRYQWAEQSAIALIERNIEEKHFLAVMRFMRGVNLKLEQDLEFRDDWWPTHQLADLWDAEKHFDNMLNKARQTLKNRKQNAQAKAGVASTMMTPQTRQPENQLKAPEGWTARRTAEGGR